MRRFGMIILVLVVFACKKTDKEKNNSMIESEEYSLNYNHQWKAQKVDLQNIDQVLYYQNSSNAFRDNINVMIENIGNEITLEEYEAISKKILHQIPHSILAESKDLLVNGKPAYYIEFEMEYNQKMQRNLQYYLIDNGKAYVVTFTADLEDFERIKPEALEVMNTFTIL